MCHQRAHTHPWTLQLDRDTGALSGWRHDRRRWHTLPPATPLAHPDTDPPEGRDPPDSPDGPDDGREGRDPPDSDRVAHGPLFDHHGHPLPF